MDTAAGHERAEGQQHPITIYLWIWATAVCFQHFLLSHRLLSFAGISKMVADHHLHVAEGRA